MLGETSARFKMLQRITALHKQQRVNLEIRFLERFDDDLSILERIVTVDMKWVHRWEKKVAHQIEEMSVGVFF